MPEPPKLQRAELREIYWDKDGGVHDGSSDKTVSVQFNPETLTVAYANQNAGGDQRGGSAVQFVGKGTTKLSMELWFDVTRWPKDQTPDPQGDVRKLTERVAYFMTPTPANEKPAQGQQQKYVPPGVRFIWGTFLFEGVMDSISEKLEYFSPDGKPLRASLTISMTAQEIQFKFNNPAQGQAGAATGSTQTPGTQPQQQAQQGDTLPQMAANNGQGSNWKEIGEKNNIDDPLRLPTGTPIQM